MKYYLMQLGCQMNISDGERLDTVLQKMGYEKTDQENEADLLGVVACSVRQKGIDKIYGKIYRWGKNDKVKTFLTGCVLDYDHHSSYIAYLPIQNGCNKFCSYCAVPFTRGREVSRQPEEIYEEVKDLIVRDYKQIVLLGQNVNSYGKDDAGKLPIFAKLLENIALLIEDAGKDIKVYFTSPHPADMSSDVFSVIARHDCLANWIHLPLQSGDDKILKSMNRSYTMVEFRDMVNDLRAKIPDVVLFTDIIVGYPGEGEEQFENTRKAVAEFDFNMIFVAAYSPRIGTKSAKLEDDVPLSVKKERLHVLTNIFKKSSYAYNKRLIGKNIKIILEHRHRKNEEYLVGRTAQFLPVQVKTDDESLIGEWAEVEITSVTALALEGILI